MSAVPTIDLDAGSDSGVSSTDNVTYGGRGLKFTGTATPFATVTLYAGGRAHASGQADANGTYSIWQWIASGGPDIITWGPESFTAINKFGGVEITAVAIDEIGNVTESEPLLVTTYWAPSRTQAPQISGTFSADILQHGAEKAKIYGMTGADTYVVTSRHVKVIEDDDRAFRLFADGNDTVRATITYTLPRNVEDLVLLGGERINGTGNTGNNSIVGNDAANRLNGRAGDDNINGGAGDDVVDGSAGNDTLAGGADNDLVRGGAGNDTLDGDAGNDRLQGNVGDDFLNGGEGDDIVDGAAGTDRLTGGLGHDVLRGGAGDDTITGGEGDDVMTGGAGHDAFIFAPGSGHDRITDFNGRGALAGDTIVLDTSVFADFEAVLAATVDNGSTLTIHAGTDSLTIRVRDISLLDATDFVFV